MFVAGISMGGCLAFRLAETQGDRVSGLVVVNPSLAGDNPLIPFTPVLKYVIRSIPSIGGDIKKPGAQEGALKKTPVASVATLPADVEDDGGRARLGDPAGARLPVHG